MQSFVILHALTCNLQIHTLPHQQQFICKICKQWPLAPNSPKWRITRANVSRQVTFFSKMANVERERMYRVRGNGWRMSGECIESGENGWRMSGECIVSGQSRAANVGASKIGRFIYKKDIFMYKTI